MGSAFPVQVIDGLMDGGIELVGGGERLGVPDAATVPRLAQLVRTRATA